jgi:hypothetical protein
MIGLHDDIAPVLRHRGAWMSIGGESNADLIPSVLAGLPSAECCPARSKCRRHSLLCSLKPLKLYRLCAGDHYGKRKSIRDER